MGTATKAYNLFILFFLCLSGLLRLNSAFLYTPRLMLSAVFLFLVVIVGVRYRKTVPWIIFTACVLAVFFGFHSYSIRNQLFEVVVFAITCMLFLTNVRQQRQLPTNGPIAFFLVMYCSVSLFSLLLLPIGYIAGSLYYHGWDSFSASVLNDQPFSVFFPLAGVARLFLFSTFAIELVRFSELAAFKKAFYGLLIGLLFSILLGFMMYFGLIGPFWLPSGWEIIKDRLAFTFGNPGWFAEYALVTVPFVFICLSERNNSLRVAVLFVLILTAVSLVFAMARAGWITYVVMLLSGLILCSVHNRCIERIIRHKIFRMVGIYLSSVLVVFLIGASIVALFCGVKRTEEASLIGNMEDIVCNTQAVSPGATTLVSVESYSKLLDRMTDTKSPRYQLWRTGLAMIMESPMIGLGYETFRWHLQIMQKIPGSNFNHSLRDALEIQDEPHNFYICLMLNGGIIGLMLWLSLAAYSFVVLLQSFIRNSNFIALGSALSLISFHSYGFFQGMQYTPVVFIVGFFCFSYALSIDQDGSALLSENNMNRICVSGMTVVGVAIVLFFIYSNAFLLRNKYNLPSYGINPEDYRYIGFYPQEGGGKTAFRWSGKKGLIPVDSPGFYSVTYRCDYPDISRYPMQVKLLAGKELVDDFHLTSTGLIKKVFFLPLNADNGDLSLSVSRTWSPRAFGLNMDHRQLGVGIRLDKLSPDEIPSQDGYIGFYAVEQWPAPAWAQRSGSSFPVRWSMGSGAISVKEICNHGCVIHIFCGHPDAKAKPVTVTISGLAAGRKQLVFHESGWQELLLSPEDLSGREYIGISADRTWNPKLLGISEDSRDLGVAIQADVL